MRHNKSILPNRYNRGVSKGVSNTSLRRSIFLANSARSIAVERTVTND